MNGSLRGLLLATLISVGSSVGAAPLDFSGKPISCIDPAGATVPTPCLDTARPRSDGYELIGYTFNILIPPPGGPPPPFPQEAKNDSERDFENPEMQDIFVWIFGNTKIDVDGAPVLFFVEGTLDGAVVTNFSQVVSGHDNHVSWNSAKVVDDVTAGTHTLDMHFGVRQLIQGQQSQVNVASLYRVTAFVPEPSSLALAALAGVALLMRRRQPLRQTRSSTTAMPCPTPMHIVHKA